MADAIDAMALFKFLPANMTHTYSVPYGHVRRTSLSIALGHVSLAHAAMRHSHMPLRVTLAKHALLACSARAQHTARTTMMKL